MKSVFVVDCFAELWKIFSFTWQQTKKFLSRVCTHTHTHTQMHTTSLKEVNSCVNIYGVVLVTLSTNLFSNITDVFFCFFYLHKLELLLLIKYNWLVVPATLSIVSQYNFSIDFSWRVASAIVQRKCYQKQLFHFLPAPRCLC